MNGGNGIMDVVDLGLTSAWLEKAETDFISSL